MQAILYIGHGSRVKAGNDELIAFVEKAKAARPHIAIQESCLLEFSKPTIAEAVESCVNQGATKIAVIPVLLLTANHAKIDIPQEIDQMKQNYPHIVFSYGRPIGIDTAIINVVKDRLRSAGFQMGDQRPKYEEREEVSILLVGRGSSDPDNTSDLMKMARLVWEYTPVLDVDVCFIAATRPNVDEGLERMNRLPNKKVFVVPYLLFTGVLMNGLQKKINHWSEKSSKTFHLCDYLGFDDQLVDVLVRRVDEVLHDQVEINCDSCQYRMALAKENVNE